MVNHFTITLENDGMGFDMVPELDEISSDPEFSLMGIEGLPKQIRNHMSSMVSATLTISGTKLTVSAMRPYSTDNNELEDGAVNLEYKSTVLVEATVIQVLCCSQVSGHGYSGCGLCEYNNYIANINTSHQ